MNYCFFLFFVNNYFRSVLSVIPGVALLTTLACFSGLVVFAYYASIGCDPLANGTLSNPNQVII